MRVTLLALPLLLSLALPASAKQTPASALGPQGALFEQALAQAGLTADDVRFDLDDRSFWGGDKYRLPFYDALQADPWKVSPYTRKLSDMLLSQANDPATVLISAQSRLNAGIRLGLTGDPLEPYQERVDELGVKALRTAFLELAAGDTRYQDPSIDESAPRAVLDSAALYLLVLPEIERLRRDAFRDVPSDIDLGQTARDLMARLRASEAEDETENGRDLVTERLLDTVDFASLNHSATLMALTLHRISQRLAAAKASGELDGMPKLAALSNTPYGRVELRGNENDSTGRWLMGYPLLIDTGGDDLYEDTVATGMVDCAALIDLAGNDRYLSQPLPEGAAGPEAGGGCFGHGMLLDLAGDDVYTGYHGIAGFGVFGTGLVYDAGGADRYSSVANSQGCGIYGTGILIDAGGNDEYQTYQYGQGYGFTKGVGLLLDAGGDDVYDANDTDIRYGGPQTALHNTSMCQGMGNGRRGDYLDGHSWAGGVGMLVDGGGADRYSCGTFGQGCSYWYGTGMLADKGCGADSYRGVWYVQGSGAHFGLSVLQDEGGNDTYWASHNMAQGAGHDWTLSWFEDGGGNDDYTAPNLSLGGANANGIGIFWDKAGDDVYRSQGVTLGCAGGVVSPSLREFMLNLGLFVDGGGDDTYLEIAKRDQENAAVPIETRPWEIAGDGKTWLRPGQSNPAVQQEYGLGIDAS